MAIRMKDIAQDLGVSVITVSKALRNHHDISAATKARVLKRVEELNYRPNYAARALVTGRSHSIGLIVPELVNSFFSEVAKGLARVLSKSGFSLLISSAEADPQIEKSAIDQLLARRVDALLIASSQWTVEAFRRVGTIATEHLIEIGCRTIAHISGRRISTPSGRLSGYKQALAAHGLPCNP